MTDRIDDDLLIRTLSEFARTLADRLEVGEVLDRLAQHLVTVVGGVGTGTSLVDQDGRPHAVTGSDELASGLVATEEQHQEGPGVEAFRQATVVSVADLSVAAERWPRWSREAQQRGVEAVLGLPLRVREQALGAISIYSKQPRRWQGSEVRVAQVLADLTAGYLATAADLDHSRRTAEQLQEALESRVVIEQAKGILANELGCTVDQAFEVLRDHARRNSVALRSVAHAVVHLGLRPPRGRTPPR